MASLIAILDLKGKPLIQRSYRDDVPATYVEKFLPIVLDLEEEGQQVTPCFSREGVNYMHIRHSNLYRKSQDICYRVNDLFIIVTGSPCVVKAKLECCGDYFVPSSSCASFGGVFQGVGGRVDSG